MSLRGKSLSWALDTAYWLNSIGSHKQARRMLFDICRRATKEQKSGKRR
jgi:hypothetical protein